MKVSTPFHVEILIFLFQILFSFVQPDVWILACMFRTTFKFQVKRLTFELVTNYFDFYRT